MQSVRVLVVDDSVTMRALFSGILDEAPGITVIDHAANADEARELIKKLRPDVVTLDVEMPGMSGVDLLAEIMETNPLPVIMLSSLTQKGSETTLRALELGAYECFAKPAQATMAEFAKIGPRLAKLVKAAAKDGAKGAVRPRAAAAIAAAGQPQLVSADYAPGNTLITLVANTGGVDALDALIAGFPANCPPTLLHLASANGFIDAFVTKLDKNSRPRIRLAADEQPLEPGNVYIISDPAKHVIVDKWPGGALRLVDGEPIGGHRPSANLLLGSIAKTLGGVASGAVLTGMGDDGVAGLVALKGAGGLTLAQAPETARAADLPELAVARGATPKELADLGRAVLLHHCAAGTAA